MCVQWGFSPATLVIIKYLTWRSYSTVYCRRHWTVIKTVIIVNKMNYWCRSGVGINVTLFFSVNFQLILEMNCDSMEWKSNPNGSKIDQIIYHGIQRSAEIHLLNLLNWCQLWDMTKYTIMTISIKDIKTTVTMERKLGQNFTTIKTWTVHDMNMPSQL